MLKRLKPGTLAPPFADYSHAVEVPPNARWLYIAGQVGVRPDGTLEEGIEAQTEQAWRNMVAVLESAGMSVADLVHYNTYIVDPGDVAAIRAIRRKYLDGNEPTATLCVVAGLASPDWLIEVEAVAAKAS